MCHSEKNVFGMKKLQSEPDAVYRILPEIGELSACFYKIFRDNGNYFSPAVVAVKVGRSFQFKNN